MKVDKCNVWIFGAGETGRMFGHYISRAPDVNVQGYVVEDQYHQELVMNNKPILRYSDWLAQRSPNDFIIIAVTGKLKNKERLYHMLKDVGSQFYTYIHPTAFRDIDVVVGEGSFIFENNVLQSGVTIGNNTILWSGNHIGHQTKIGNHCFIASHVVLCGHVSVADRCFFGVNTAVAPNVTIQCDAFIGMGVNITYDVPQGTKITAKDTRDVYSSSTIHP